MVLRMKAYLDRRGITTMVWLPMLPNLVSNIWSLRQNKVYRGQKVYKNTTNLWNAITAAWHALLLETFKYLYESIMDPGYKTKR